MFLYILCYNYTIFLYIFCYRLYDFFFINYTIFLYIFTSRLYNAGKLQLSLQTIIEIQ